MHGLSMGNTAVHEGVYKIKILCEKSLLEDLVLVFLMKWQLITLVERL